MSADFVAVEGTAVQRSRLRRTLGAHSSCSKRGESGADHGRPRGGFGRGTLEVIGAGAIPPEASRRHAEAGEHGDYPRALDLLEQAHRLAPDCLYPVYKAAFTYLLQGNSPRAESTTQSRSHVARRGFFTAKTSLDCLRRKRAGVLLPGF
jgi:hypothetical protein